MLIEGECLTYSPIVLLLHEGVCPSQVHSELERAAAVTNAPLSVSGGPCSDRSCVDSCSRAAPAPSGEPSFRHRWPRPLVVEWTCTLALSVSGRTSRPSWACCTHSGRRLCAGGSHRRCCSSWWTRTSVGLRGRRNRTPPRKVGPAVLVARARYAPGAASLHTARAAGSFQRYLSSRQRQRATDQENTAIASVNADACMLGTICRVIWRLDFGFTLPLLVLCTVAVLVIAAGFTDTAISCLQAERFSARCALGSQDSR